MEVMQRDFELNLQKVTETLATFGEAACFLCKFMDVKCQ